MNLTDAVQTFNDALFAEVKPRTLGWYNEIIHSLLEMFGPYADVCDISPADLRRWRREMCERETQYGRPPSVSTRNGYLRAAKRFFNFLHSEGHIQSNPAARLSLTYEDDEPKAANLDDFSRLVSYFQRRRINGVRNLAILLFLFDTGCRVSTVCTVTIEEIDWQNGAVWIHEKGRSAKGKGRNIFFSPLTLHTMRQYVARYRPQIDAAELFLNQRKQPLSRNGVWSVLNTAAQKAGCTGPVNPHAWRHAFAIERLKKGQNLSSVSKMMGHATIAITHKSYGRWAADELREEHQKYSPLNDNLLDLLQDKASGHESYVNHGKKDGNETT